MTAGSVIATEHFTADFIDLENGGSLKLRPLISGAYGRVQWQDSVGALQADLGISSVSGNPMIFDGGNRELRIQNGSGDIKITPASNVDLVVTTAASAGALQGYMVVKVGGVQRKIPYYAV